MGLSTAEFNYARVLLDHAIDSLLDCQEKLVAKSYNNFSDLTDAIISALEVCKVL